jgi:hypothetical protein
VNALARAARGWLAGATFAAGALAFGLGAHAQGQSPVADFGVPPSGEIPIIFNDHHVYAKPSHLQSGRVLSAIVRHNTILVPLRAMFEQTGATVSYDASTRTVDVSKPGADVKVTVGKAWVVINGAERPLDVPPEVYEGTIVVPLRVISEGMGAYVQWVPEKHLVVIRYVEAVPEAPPATPAPTPRPTPVPTVKPTATPTPTPAPKKNFERYVAGDYMVSPKVYNELSPGDKAHTSYEVKGAVEFPLFGPTWEISANWRHYLYPHESSLGVIGCSPGTLGCNTVIGGDPHYQVGVCPAPGDPGCVTTVGAGPTGAQSGLKQVYITAFNAQENDIDTHFGIKLASPRIYLGVGGLFRTYNYLGYPRMAGVGFGVEKLPDLDQPFSIYGSAFYYPHVSGKYTYPTAALLGPLSGAQVTLAYSEWKYELGVTTTFGAAFLDIGYAGEHLSAKTNAPSNVSINGPYVGLGLHF